MSTPRRGGLGKGLGALIATSTERPEVKAQPDEETTTQQADPVAPATPVDDVPTPTPRSAADTADDVAEASTPSMDPARTPDPQRGPSQPVPPVSFGGVRLIEVDPTAVARNPRQPRDVFDQEEIDQLATSLLDVGMLQPLVVRPLDGDRYELVAGERRLRAAMVAGLPTVPAIVRATEDADLLKEALVENIHRVQLNPLEEAAAYQQLLEDFGVTQEELASRLGRSRPTISNTIRLLSLPPGVQRRIAAGVLTAGHAKALLSLEGTAAQQRLADRVVAEGLSVRATEEAARLMQGEDIDSPAGSRSGGSRARLKVPGLIELQDDLSDALEARVRISMGARKGKLTVEFLSVNDLERIVGIIADGLGSPSSRSNAAGGSTDATEAAVTSQATAAEALAQRRHVRFDDLTDLDLEGIRRATDLSDLDD
jgi:ParB family transcriptional regulator, chromosome partitioning protein